jgi:transposase, IS30 family
VERLAHEHDPLGEPAVVVEPAPENPSPCVMGVRERQREVRAFRGQMWSPGRPSTARHDDRVRFWEAIARGLSSEDAAGEVGVSQAVGSGWFRQAGGMPPLALAPVSGRYLSFAEREEIAILHAQQVGVREIARRIGRSPSTISRELRRNASTRTYRLEYRASTAQWHAERRASRPKVAKLAANDRLREYVQDRLAGTIARPDGEPVPGPEVRFIGRRHGRRADRRWARSWSPEQISNRLGVDFPDDESMRISHEAIYQALYVQGRGALRRELVACLRTGRALRVPRARTRGRGKTFVTPEILISQRPAEAQDRAVPGHWEGDLIVGLDSSAIGTLVERTTRFALLLYLPRMDGHGNEPRAKNGPALAGHGAQAVRDAIAEVISTLPEQLRRSLTWDQGAEMAQHAQLRIDTGLDIFFCDPHSPWQRGTNENTNGLLRQYFPKGTDLARHSRDDLDAVALALNTRPRKTLSWKTPAEALDELLRSA